MKEEAKQESAYDKWDIFVVICDPDKSWWRL